MMGYYGSGMPAWMSIVDALISLLFWGGLAVLIVYAVRAFGGRRDGRESADEILRRRLAAGEITQEDYEKTSKALHG